MCHQRCCRQVVDKAIGSSEWVLDPEKAYVIFGTDVVSSMKENKTEASSSASRDRMCIMSKDASEAGSDNGRDKRTTYDKQKKGLQC